MTLPEDVPETKNNVDDHAKVNHSRKIKLIQTALKNEDHTKLLQLAISKDGLISDRIRRKVWPKLLKLDQAQDFEKPDIKEVEAHPYYNQVVLDVNRALRRFPPSIEEQQRMAMQDQLIILIVQVLMKHPELHYYQGYHDICVTFLLVLGEKSAFPVVEKLSLLHLKSFMEATMETTSNLLHYVFVIIGRENNELRSYMEKADVGVLFCLSWVITWFGHVLENYTNVVRLYDFFLACQPLMPVYLAAAIILHRQDEIMAVECDMAIMHHTLQQVSDNLPFEKLVNSASQLFIQYPPEDLTEEHQLILAKKAQELLEEKERFRRIKREWDRKNKGVLVIAYHTMNSWLFSKQQRWRNWTLTIATGTAIAVAVYAVFHTYIFDHSSKVL